MYRCSYSIAEGVIAGDEAVGRNRLLAVIGAGLNLTFRLGGEPAEDVAVADSSQPVARSPRNSMETFPVGNASIITMADHSRTGKASEGILRYGTQHLFEHDSQVAERTGAVADKGRSVHRCQRLRLQLGQPVERRLHER
jgi:hypothetical protein